MTKKKSRIGLLFDDYLTKENIYEEVTARAIRSPAIAGRCSYAGPETDEVEPCKAHEDKPCPA